MRQIIPITKDAVSPSLAAVLRSQGISEGTAASERVMQLAEMSLIIYHELSAPVGLVMEINREEFTAVYQGQGLNEKSTPLGQIAPAAERLALFAITLGKDVSDRISLLFDEQEFALGALLDGVASESAEMASQVLESEYQEYLKRNGLLKAGIGLLPFSPGYCGWHISAQRKLFDVLQADEIGIFLGESFLMEPLKSVSGVFVAAPKEAFAFDDDFPFCATCRTRTCRERIQAVLAQ